MDNAHKKLSITGKKIQQSTDKLSVHLKVTLCNNTNRLLSNLFPYNFGSNCAMIIKTQNCQLRPRHFFLVLIQLFYIKLLFYNYNLRFISFHQLFNIFRFLFNCSIVSVSSCRYSWAIWKYIHCYICCVFASFNIKVANYFL